MSSSCGPPSLRPCAFYICLLAMPAASQACGLWPSIYICLRPWVPAAWHPGCEFVLEARHRALGVDPKKRGLVAPDTCYPADARAPAKRL